jgi:hypothetical protein
LSAVYSSHDDQIAMLAALADLDARGGQQLPAQAASRAGYSELRLDPTLTITRVEEIVACSPHFAG